MKTAFITLLLALSVTASPVLAQDKEQVTGIISGVDSQNRLLYIHDQPYRLARDVKLTSSTGKFYYDASSLQPGTVAKYTWTTKDGQRVITALHLHEDMQDVPQ